MRWLPSPAVAMLTGKSSQLPLTCTVSMPGPGGAPGERPWMARSSQFGGAFAGNGTSPSANVELGSTLDTKGIAAAVERVLTGGWIVGGQAVQGSSRTAVMIDGSAVGPSI